MIASRCSNGKLAAFDDATLEKYGYFIQLLNRFPAFYEVVHNDYHLNASKSGWSLTKVFFLFIFFSSLFIYMQTNFTDFREAPEDILVAVYSAIARNDVANAGIVYLFILCVLFSNIVFFKLLEAVKKLLATLANRSAICKRFPQMSIVSILLFFILYLIVFMLGF